jgi:hypothetical protein
MPFHNNCLYNAAASGALEGMLIGRQPLPAVSGGASNLALAAAAQAFATEVDSLIATDPAITTSGVTPTILAITGASNAQIGPEFEKINIMKCICAGLWTGRLSTDATAADYANLAAQAVAMYTDALTVLVSP